MTDRRRRYESTVETVRLNTSTDPSVNLPPAMSHGPLVNNRVRAGYSWDKVEDAIAAAVSNGDLVRIEATDRPRYAPVDPDHLRSLAGVLADADPAPREDIARINRALG
jgi:hypothetical protein